MIEKGRWGEKEMIRRGRWNGVEWGGVGWNGMEWDEMDRVGLKGSSMFYEKL